MTTAIVPKNDLRSQKAFLITSLEKAKTAMSAIIPPGSKVTPERIISVISSAVNRNPGLLECSTGSIVRCSMQACEYGLEVGGVTGHAHFLPFRKDGVKEATLVLGYQGLLELVRRSGILKSISAEVVRKGEYFDIEYGLHPKLMHKPMLEGVPGEPIGAYAVAILTGDVAQFIFLTKDEIDKVRLRSPSGSDSRGNPAGVWREWPDAMWKKTALRRLCKLLPMQVTGSDAIDKALSGQDDDYEDPDVIDIEHRIDESPSEVPDEAPLAPPPAVKKANPTPVKATSPDEERF